MKNSWKAIGLAACLAVLLLLLGALPRREQWLSLARDPDLIRRFTGWIDSIGSAGIPVLLLFQIFQIVVAILPGGLVELAGGILYGPFGDLPLPFSEFCSVLSAPSGFPAASASRWSAGW